jgi:lipoate---protein ligase
MGARDLWEGPPLEGMTCFELTRASVDHELALDEALLIEADGGRGGRVLRFWEPADYAVVLGASGRIGEDLLVDACRADGVPIFRRSSGGGTVVVGPGALSVTLILPESAAPGLTAVDQAQHYVLDRIARSIERTGPEVTVAGRGDLVWGDRKCGGSAQRRLKHWFMVHCSILYDFPIDRIVRYLAIPRRQPEYRLGREHHDFLSNLGVPRNILMDAIRGAWLSGPSSPVAPAVSPALVESLMAEKFTNRTWIERL